MAFIVKGNHECRVFATPGSERTVSRNIIPRFLDYPHVKPYFDMVENVCIR